jgi:hypothetical protein
MILRRTMCPGRSSACHAEGLGSNPFSRLEAKNTRSQLAGDLEPPGGDSAGFEPVRCSSSRMSVSPSRRSRSSRQPWPPGALSSRCGDSRDQAWRRSRWVARFSDRARSRRCHSSSCPARCGRHRRPAPSPSWARGAVLGASQVAALLLARRPPPRNPAMGGQLRHVRGGHGRLEREVVLLHQRHQAAPAVRGERGHYGAESGSSLRYWASNTHSLSAGPDLLHCVRNLVRHVI